MVAVAIIGILAAIAIPSYQRYAARTRQSEAKIELSEIYTFEQGFFAENSTFTGCLVPAGFTVPALKRYYTVGFNDYDEGPCGPAGNETCSCYIYSGTSC